MIGAAGALPWRRERGELQVALVHRPRYDDWSWAKGKLDPGEQWPVAAVREVEEETGLVVRLGRPLPAAAYTVVDRRGAPAPKQVRYWAAEVTGGDGVLRHEVDEVAWLGAADAAGRLSRDRDRDQLRALVRADGDGALATWPLVLVRHARALPRSGWEDDDQLRPLDGRGLARARDLAPLLSAYGVGRLVSSPSVRCTQSLQPYAATAALPLLAREGLSEEGHAVDPGRSVRHLDRLLERGEPAALCSHGPVLPGLLTRLGCRAGGGAGSGAGSVDGADARAAAALAEAADLGMAKGEALVVHLVGTGTGARVVAAERHAP